MAATNLIRTFFDIMKNFLDQWSARICGTEMIKFLNFQMSFMKTSYPYRCHFDLRRGRGGEEGGRGSCTVST